ncbi:DinB family protein [Thalassoroseus pseudoceratinae]|uniref:DinB family protein n=1 Tax=Thalassoroseus pseudoceratinae TaxID=2713176 RepID=UPI00142077ED|nr:DinB family protein [Thalassoroseus pseudoceratinae]
MGIIETTLKIWEFNRQRTLGTLDEIASHANATEILGWRPGPGRAHIAWQLVHVGVTEELFATERILETSPAFADLIPRFKGGSTPDDDIPNVDTIRTVLNESREHLRSTVSKFQESELDTVPEPLRERNWSIGKVLQVMAWHEPHHQGQAHITLNLWKAQQ